MKNCNRDCRRRSRHSARLLGNAVGFLLFCCLPGEIEASPIRLSDFNSLITLGESLVDTGNVLSFTEFNGLPENPNRGAYFEGRFTNGPNLSDLLEDAITGANAGHTNSLRGGTNYAYGAARLNPTGLIPDAFTLLGPGGQVDQLLMDGGVSIDHLVLLWAGNNDWRDLLAAAAELFSMGSTLPEIQAFLLAGKDAILMQMLELFDRVGGAGAEKILWLNTPDLTMLPGFVAAGLPSELVEQVRNLIIAYNLELALAVAALPGLHTELFDAFEEQSTTSLAINNTMAFPPCNPNSNTAEPLMVPVELTCGDPDAVLFWDTIHPTAAAHRELANGILAQIPSPASWLLMLPGLVLLRRQSS